MIRCVFALVLLAQLAAAQDILVVTPKEFGPALADWRAHRAAQGHAIAVAEPGKDVGAVVKARWKRSGGKLRFVLIVGDVNAVPCAYVMAQAINAYERDPRIATDNAYADLDGDHIPDLAIGRMPARTPEEAKALLAKVIAYETSKDFTRWRRKVNLIAGVGGFGVMQDWAIETLTNMLLRDNVPLRYEVSLTYGSPKSPYCPHPRDFAGVALERFNEGALFVAYVGHGHATGVDEIRYEGKRYPILAKQHLPLIESKHGAPISVFLACSTGKYDGKKECLAVEILRRPRGPVAIIASSRVSMPYANGMFAKEILDAAFIGEAETLGELMVRAKRRLVTPDQNDERRRLIETIAATFYKPTDPKGRAVERREHVHLYNLLGDPAMRIPRPAALTVTCAQEISAGKRLKIVGESSMAGDLLVELARMRSAPVSPRPAGDKSRKAFNRAYRDANNRIVSAFVSKMKAGRFEVVLPVRETVAPGDYVVRLFLTGEDGAAAGARKVKVIQ
jgi:hypothetical protein